MDELLPPLVPSIQISPTQIYAKSDLLAVRGVQENCNNLQISFFLIPLTIVLVRKTNNINRTFIL